MEAELGEFVAISNGPSPIVRRSTFAELVEKHGQRIVNKAEVLAAMDCLMHHLSDEEDFESWKINAMPDMFNWNILDWDPGEASKRTEDYVRAVENMTDHEYECITHMFADIVRCQCFDTKTLYKWGAFDFMGVRKMKNEGE